MTALIAFLILILLMWQFGVLLPVTVTIVAVAILCILIGMVVGMGRAVIQAIDSAEDGGIALVVGIATVLLFVTLYFIGGHTSVAPR